MGHRTTPPDEAQVLASLSAAQALYACGRYAEALTSLRTLDPQGLPTPLARRLLSLRTSTLYGLRRFQEAEREAQALVALSPRDADAWLTLGLLYCRLGRPAQALPILHRAESLGADGYTLHDTLAAAMAQMGDRAGALRHGEQALLLKDREACAAMPVGSLRRTEAPPFRADRPERNILAFSLWGDQPKYTQGALANARLAKVFFPGWTCRFYADDTVPAQVVAELEALGAQVVPMPRPRFPEEGMFQRFTVSDDPGIDRFLVRDADCEPGERERKAVEAWIASGKLFHAMRDHPGHTELMLGGLWGGVAGALPPIKELMAGFPMDNHAVLDQVFLRRRVWPLAKDAILVHDGHYRVLGAEPFPADAPANIPGHHVGGGIERQASAQVKGSAASAKAPRLCVIMPAHNAAPFIGAAIRSILGQTFQDFELIVVDDGSTDGTAQEVARFDDPRIVFLRNERNLGPSAARNRAIEAAKGEFIAPMDADDVSLPQRLERNLAWMEKRPGCIAVGGSMMIWEPGKVLRPAIAQIEPAEARRMVLRAPPVNHATCIIRRKAFDAGVRYRTEFDGAEDYRLWLDLLEHGELATEPEVVYHYRMHPGQQAQAGREKVRSAAQRVRASIGSPPRLPGAPSDAEKFLVLSFHTPTHAGLFRDFLEKTMPQDCRLAAIEVEQLCPQGAFMRRGWNETMERKVGFILEHMAAMPDGQVFAYLDADVAILSPGFRNAALQELGDFDLACQNDQGTACAGVMVIRNNPATRALFRRVGGNCHVDNADQGALNQELQGVVDVKWKLLSERFWNPSMGGAGKDAVLAHANYVVGIDSKKALLARMCGLFGGPARPPSSSAILPAPSGSSQGFDAVEHQRKLKALLAELNTVVHRGAFSPGCGSYLMDGRSLAYDPSTLEKQRALHEGIRGRRKVLEIGTYLGHSALIMLCANPGLELTCVDVDPKWAKPAVEFLRRRFPDAKVRFLHGNMRSVSTQLGDGYDAVHIDGSHVPADIEADYTAASKLLGHRVDNLVVFDDYAAHPAFIEEVARTHSTTPWIPGGAYTNALVFIRKHGASAVPEPAIQGNAEILSALPAVRTSLEASPCADGYQTHVNALFAGFHARHDSPVYPAYNRLPNLDVLLVDALRHGMLGDRHVISVYGGTYIRSRTALRPAFEDLLGRLDPTRKYILFADNDHGFSERLPPDTWVYSAGCKDGGAPLPFVASPVPGIAIPGEKRHLASFVGSRTHPIRERLLRLYGRDPDFRVELAPWRETQDAAAVARYLTATAESVYCLCPRGYSAGSYRLLESLQLGAIPVYLSDDFLLPFDNIIPWREFIVMATERELPGLKEKLQGISAERRSAMREQGQEVWRKHFSTPARIVEAARRSILERIGSG